MAKYLLMFLALAGFDVQAAIVCAKTGNELGNAMLTASANAVDDEIRVVIGTHTSNLRAPDSAQWRVDAVESHDGDHNLTISGGWNAADNCATQSSLNPSATVLDALYFGPVFSYTSGLEEPMVATFTIRNLTFNRGMAASDGPTSGLLVSVELSGAGSAVVDNVHVLNGRSEVSSAQAIHISGVGSGAIRLRNSIVSLNSYTLDYSSMVRIQPEGNVVAYVSNNSIFSNATTTQAAGLEVTGVATISNNAVADNTSTANPNYQFYSNAPTALTLIKNHFSTKGVANGVVDSESDTTTGDAAWTGVGVERIPLDVSPLRDSGNNSPTGGALAIDFRGNPRVVNTIMDRGASEAPVSDVPGLGPIVTPNTPVSASTTWLFGEAGQSALGEITFSSSEGGINGLTQIVCEVTSGTILVGSNLTQYVATGYWPEPMLIGFDSLTTTVQSGVILCSFQRGGVPGFTFASYNFKGGLQTTFKNGFESP